MRMTIRRKLLLSFFGIIILFSSTVVSSFVFEKKNEQLQREMNILRNQLDTVQVLNFMVRSTDGDMSYHLMSTSEEDQRKYLVNYQQGMTNVTNNLNTLKSITTDEQDLTDITRFELEWQKYTRGNESVIKELSEGSVQKAQSLFTQIDIYPIIESLISFTQRQKTKVDSKQAEMDANDALTIMIGSIIMVITLVLSVVIVFAMNRTISRPLMLVSKQMKEIAEGEGDLTRELSIRSKDEVGDLAQSFNKMLQNLRGLIHQVGLTTEQVAASAEELTASAEQTSKATEQIASTIQEMAEGSKQQVHSVEQSSNVANESLLGIQQIAANTQNVSAIAVQTSEKAVEGNQLLQAAASQMTTINLTFNGLSKVIRGLGERSQEIGQISEVITAIAGQTNLLALNAAIEAARAGEHGRGFAVVADEVRKLAEQSSVSAQQISELIAAIQQETGTAVESMELGAQEVSAGINGVNAAGDSFRQIQQSIEEVTTQIQEVSAAAQMMYAGTEQIVHSINVISEVAKESASGTENVSAASEEQMASMEEIASSASTLSHMAEELQVLIGRFKV